MAEKRVTSNALLLDGVRRLHEGCLHCGEPATQIVPAYAPYSAYIGICPHHLDYEPNEPMPLVDLLDALGVGP